jgi:hypothetical protein
MTEQYEMTDKAGQRFRVRVELNTGGLWHRAISALAARARDSKRGVATALHGALVVTCESVNDSGAT